VRLAGALAIAVGFVLGYAMLPALRPAGAISTARLPGGDGASGTPLPTGAPVAVVEEEAAGALVMPRAAVPGRGGIPVPSGGTSVPSRRPSPAASTIAPSPRPSAGVASAGGHRAVARTTLATWTRRTGNVSHMGYAFPPSYLALPHGRGVRARICGPRGCVTMTSTDAGPAKYMQRAPYYRIADLSVAAFWRVCGSPRLGLCRATVTVL